MNNFQYSLVRDGEFRIAVLQPSIDRTAGIEVELSIAVFEKTPAYEALSYVWGDSSITSPIALQEQAFNVTTNLFAALRRLRLEDRPRNLWIDSICIDQSNARERQIQISRMRDIYTIAARTVIWMGNEDERLAISAANLTSLAFATLRDNPGLMDEKSRDFAPNPGQAVRVRNFIRNHPWFQEHAEPAQSFLGNSWFRRVWTFQEAYLGRDIEVVCGDVSFPWEPFVMSWGLLDRFGVKLLLKGMDSVRTLFATCSWDWESQLSGGDKYHNRLRLSNLMRSTYAHQATNKKDLIFGLLAMVQPRTGIRFEPDYGVSIEEVYERFARLMILDDGHLRILSDAQVRVGTSSLPSWVPDWRENNKLNQLAERIRDFKRTYNLNAGFEPANLVASTSESRKLHLRGARLGTVEARYSLDSLMDAIHSSKIRPGTWKDIISEFKRVFYLPGVSGCHGATSRAEHLLVQAKDTHDAVNYNQRILNLPADYAYTREPIFTAFIPTLSGDFLPNSERVGEDCQHHYPWFHDYQNMTWKEAFKPLALIETSMHNSPYVDLAGAPVQEVMNLLFDVGNPTKWETNVYDTLRGTVSKAALIYQQISVEICHLIHATAGGRCFYVTDNGFLGLGPKKLEIGDVVYDLLGGDVPFVLRETEISGELTLLGDSYVHGIMDGELWEIAKGGAALEPVDGSYTWVDVVLV